MFAGHALFFNAMYNDVTAVLPKLSSIPPLTALRVAYNAYPNVDDAFVIKTAFLQTFAIAFSILQSTMHEFDAVAVCPSSPTTVA